MGHLRAAVPAVKDHSLQQLCQERSQRNDSSDLSVTHPSELPLRSPTGWTLECKGACWCHPCRSESTGNSVWWRQVESRSGDEEANGRYLPHSIKLTSCPSYHCCIHTTPNLLQYQDNSESRNTDYSWHPMGDGVGNSTKVMRTQLNATLISYSYIVLNKLVEHIYKLWLFFHNFDVLNNSRIVLHIYSDI